MIIHNNLDNKFHLEIQISNLCNLNCKHCLMNDSLDDRIIDYDKLYDFINKNKDNICEVHFAGGEPLLHPSERLLDIIKDFKDIKFHMTSNLQYEITDLRRDIIESLYDFSTSFDYKIRFNTISELLLWKSNLRKIKEIRKDKDINVFVTVTSLLVDNISVYRLSKFFNKLKVYYTLNPLIMLGKCKYNKYLIPDINKEAMYIYNSISLNDKYNLTKCRILRKEYTNCEYNNKYIKNYDIDLNEIRCVKDKNCKHINCNFYCEYNTLCNGRCKYINCLGKFNKDIYYKCKELSK